MMHPVVEASWAPGRGQLLHYWRLPSARTDRYELLTVEVVVSTLDSTKSVARRTSAQSPDGR